VRYIINLNTFDIDILLSTETRVGFLQPFNAAAPLTVIPAVIKAGIPALITASGAGYVKPKRIILSVITAVIPVGITAVVFWFQPIR